MIFHGSVLVTKEVIQNYFVCNLKKCKGGCCANLGYGAPLEKEELSILENIQESIAPYLTKEGKESIQKKGYYKSEDGHYSTPLTKQKNCVYAYQDQEGVYKCAIEKAYQEGKINFPKPISCHLYPIRIAQRGDIFTLHYHQWDICKPACQLGEKLKTPIFKFVKAGLVRKFGAEWYNGLEEKLQ